MYNNYVICFQFRPKHNPLAWPLAPPAKDPSSDAPVPVKKDSVGVHATSAGIHATSAGLGALNPNVPEFVPSFGAAGMTPFSAVSWTRLMDKG